MIIYDQVMRHLSSAECSDLEKLLDEDSSASRDGASMSMARSPIKVCMHMSTGSLLCGGGYLNIHA